MFGENFSKFRSSNLFNINLFFALFILSSVNIWAAPLTGLTISEGDLSPNFLRRIYSYTSTIPSGITSTTVTPSGRSNFNVTINGVTTTINQASSPIALSEGPNTIEVVVWNNRSTHTYTITANVEAGSPNTPPTINITSPTNSTTVPVGTALSFLASATDTEDGNLESSIIWTSSLDGQLFVGNNQSVELSIGSHTITSSVTDSDDNTVTDNITVSISDTISSAQPNILFILADDMGAEASTLYPSLAGDNGQISTPNIETLAQNGIVFENAWVNPVCTPTRGNFVSGQYGNRTGVTSVNDVLNPNTTTSIWEYISTSSPENYNMAVYGKWHLGDNVSQHGIQEFKGFLPGYIDDYFNWTWEDANGNSTNTTTYSTTLMTDWAIDFITTHEGQSIDPWFVYLPYNAPHAVNASTIFQVPPSHLHSVDLGTLQPGDQVQGSTPVYQATIQAMDTEIGRLMENVDLNSTIVIFMGDNGTPSVAQDDNVGLQGAKGSVFEGGVRVPMVISGSGVTRLGEREDDIVQVTDLYATIGEVSGINVSQVENGYSLMALLSDANSSSGRNYAFTELCNQNSSYAIRNSQYKLLFNRNGWGLYDLTNDLLETNNLYNDLSVTSVQATLETELGLIEAQATDGCF